MKRKTGKNKIKNAKSSFSMVAILQIETSRNGHPSMLFNKEVAIGEWKMRKQSGQNPVL